MIETVIRTRPTPSNEYLANPHKGCCTFQHFNGDPLFPGLTWSEEGPTEFPPEPTPTPRSGELLHPLTPPTPGYLPTTVAYCRWFWRLVEPVQGKFDFTVIDKSIETARRRGQTLAIRVMPFGSAGQPQLPDWYVAKYPTKKESHNGEINCPIYDSPEYLEHWGAIARELGRRYDGHPMIDTIDVCYVGPWGEGAGVCTQQRHHEFHQLWKDAWPTTPRYCEVSDEQMIAGMAAGTGWRINSFGDLNNQGTDTNPRHLAWNHHYEVYPRAVHLFADDAWKKRPVHLETGWVPMYWHQKGWDIDFILEQGLKYHATYFMPKSSRLPDAWMDKLAAFCRKLGYCFVLRQALLPLQLKRGANFHYRFWIDNVGVAPLYRPFVFALRFRHDDHAVILPLPGVDVRNWLPGDNWVEGNLTLPADFPPGFTEPSVGIIDPRTQQVIVKFAVKERFADGWTPLNPIMIE